MSDFDPTKDENLEPTENTEAVNEAEDGITVDASSDSSNAETVELDSISTAETAELENPLEGLTEGGEGASEEKPEGEEGEKPEGEEGEKPEGEEGENAEGEEGEGEEEEEEEPEPKPSIWRRMYETPVYMYMLFLAFIAISVAVYIVLNEFMSYDMRIEYIEEFLDGRAIPKK